MGLMAKLMGLHLSCQWCDIVRGLIHSRSAEDSPHDTIHKDREREREKGIPFWDFITGHKLRDKKGGGFKEFSAKTNNATLSQFARYTVYWDVLPQWAILGVSFNGSACLKKNSQYLATKE